MKRNSAGNELRRLTSYHDAGAGRPDPGSRGEFGRKRFGLAVASQGIRARAAATALLLHLPARSLSPRLVGFVSWAEVSSCPTDTTR